MLAKFFIVALLTPCLILQNGLAAAGTQEVTIAAVGDVMVGSSYPDESSLPPNDGKDLIMPFVERLRAADMTFWNLEDRFSKVAFPRSARPQSPLRRVNQLQRSTVLLSECHPDTQQI